MSRKSLKILLVLVTILSLISTFSFATEPSSDAADVAVTTSLENPTDTGDTAADNNETNETAPNVTPDTDADLSSDASSSEASTNHDVYLTEKDVKIADSETINGNAFVIGETVTINGQIGGDLFVIANTLNIDGGQIFGNVFALANNVTLNGLIYDLYAVCNNLTMSYDGVAYRDLKVTCSTATINGVIGKNINIKAGQSLELQSDCLVYGDLNYSAPNEIEIAEGVVTGSVNYEKLSVVSSNQNNVMDYVLALLATLVYTLVVWSLLSKFAPKFYGKITEMKPKKMLMSILIGLLTIIVVPLVAFLLLITVVGVPVAFALLGIYMLIISIAFALVSISLASKLAKKATALAKFNNLFAVIIVAIVLWALGQIPYVCGVVTLLVTLCGLGMFISSLLNKKEKATTPKAE